MRRFATVLAVVLGVAALFGGVSQAAPEWTRTAGLDFWNLSAEREQFRASAEREEDLTARHETARRRGEVAEGIAASLCDGTRTLAEAVERVKALADADPEWFAELTYNYRAAGRVAPTATDRDVAICYLFIKIDGMQYAAEQVGDVSRAAFISDRLNQLHAER